jgi:transcriptional regulator with XRE-family HTH domain
MTVLNRGQIARLVKEGRSAKGVTQQELSEKAGISLRSVQRIENGEVLPRPYTIRVLAEQLGFLEALEAGRAPVREKRKLNQPRKLIISIGLGLLLLLGALAFVAQSARFPETDFERFLLWGGVVAVYTIVLFKVWK